MSDRLKILTTGNCGLVCGSAAGTTAAGTVAPYAADIGEPSPSELVQRVQFRVQQIYQSTVVYIRASDLMCHRVQYTL